MAYASAVTLTVRDAKKTGTPVSYGMVAPTATHGNKFANDGRTVFRVKNNSASPITVTLYIPATLEGQTVTPVTVTVDATGDLYGGDFVDIGPFSSNFNQSDGFVHAVCSAVTDILVGAYRILPS